MARYKSTNRSTSIALSDGYWLFAFIFIHDLDNVPAFIASKIIEYCYRLRLKRLGQFFHNYLLRPFVTVHEWEYIAAKKHRVITF